MSTTPLSPEDRKGLKAVRIFLLILTLAMLALLMSCSASWHVRQAMKKDPAMFRDTVRTVTRLDAPPVGFEFDCFDVRPVVEMTAFRRYKDEKGKDRVDTVKIKMSRQDSLDLKSKWQGEIHCPDPEVVVETLPPVILEQTTWQFVKANWLYLPLLIGIGISLGLSVSGIFRR